ncbi:MAG: hypothetical protein ACYS29_04920 [Planctomycetota bacterium]|jgi:hypothetical protein
MWREKIEQGLAILAASGILLGVSSRTEPQPAADSGLSVTGPGSTVKLQEGTQMVFAEIEEAKERLTTRDTFIETMSGFDRAARVKTDRDVSVDEFLEFIARQVRPWSDDERHRISVAAESVAGKLARFELNLPERILLVKTTGHEEGGATYTRAEAIVIPQNQLDKKDANLENLIIHELFHVLTGHNSRIKEALYEIINFKKCNEIELPDSLRETRITNPDGPLNNHYVEVQHNLQAVPVVPIIYSAADKYDVEKGGAFFRYITFRLLVMEESDGRWPYERSTDGEPILLEVKNVPDYFVKIGANTNYIIHPDEILAENFVLLVNNVQNVRSKWVIEKMEKVLLRQPPAQRK